MPACYWFSPFLCVRDFYRYSGTVPLLLKPRVQTPIDLGQSYVRQNKGHFEDALPLHLKAYHLQLIEGNSK